MRLKLLTVCVRRMTHSHLCPSRTEKIVWNQFPRELILVPDDPLLPVTFATDASPYGVSAVLSHTLPDGKEKPVAFHSRVLTPTEQRYNEFYREAVVSTEGVKKFQYYLSGRRFTLITDNKPLFGILSPGKGISSLAATRLQQYAILLAEQHRLQAIRCARQRKRALSVAANIGRTAAAPSRRGPKHLSLFYTRQFKELPVTSTGDNGERSGPRQGARSASRPAGSDTRERLPRYHLRAFDREWLPRPWPSHRHSQSPTRSSASQSPQQAFWRCQNI